MELGWRYNTTSIYIHIAGFKMLVNEPLKCKYWTSYNNKIQ